MAQYKTEWLTRTSAQGQKLSISLPDGTRVLLNNGSTIRYPKAFTNRFRETELSGEAFFHVNKDDTKPFKIRTGVVVSTALGTTFNIQAFPKENTAITVISGLLQVKSSLVRNQGRSNVSSTISFTASTTVVLSSGQQAQFDALGTLLSRREVYSENYLGWTDGEIELDPATEGEAEEHVTTRIGEDLNLNPDSKNVDSTKSIRVKI